MSSPLYTRGKNYAVVAQWLFAIGMVVLPAVSVAQPLEANNATISSCTFINTVAGSSGYGKKFNWQSEAKTVALSQAEKLGASHVVWEAFNPVGAFNGVAVAKVYKCTS